MMKIYTKTGDKGKTSLLLGGRVAKHHPRVEVYGTFDELNSVIGVVRSFNDDSEVEKILDDLQPRIHLLCADVAAQIDDSPAQSRIIRIKNEDVAALELVIDRMQADVPPLKTFILPSGSKAGAMLHLARTVSRRAERRLTELVDLGESVNEYALQFANRLSDFFFVLARWANHRSGCEEYPWEPKSK